MERAIPTEVRLARARPLFLLVLSAACSLLSACTAAAAANRSSTPSWVAAWGLPVNDAATTSFQDETIRVVARAGFGGSRVRIRLSNATGTQPLTLRDAHIGVAGSGAGVTTPNVPLTFNGAASVTIPPGRQVMSDPADLRVTALQNLAVSVYAPTSTGPGIGDRELSTYYTASGDQAGDTTGSPYGPSSSGGYFVTGIDVYAPNDGLIVGFGDSITVGFLASDEGWPYWLANRLVQLAAQGGPRYSIIDMGISGNDVAFDRSGYGVSAEHRLQRDVLDQTGLKAVLMLEGINDIGGSNLRTATLEGGLASVVARVRAAGAGILLSPMTPSGDATAPAPYGLNYSSPAGEQERHDVNSWIRRSSGAYSPFFDLDPVIADPQEPNHMALAYNSADNLHPSVPGQQAMAASIDLASVEQLIPASPPMTGPNRLRLDSTRLVVRKRRVFVPLTCDSTRQCSGLFSIDANLPLAHSGSVTAVCLVSRDAFYRLGAHQRQTVSVPMQQSCLRALERHRGKLRVKVTSWPRGGQHRIVSYATLIRK